MKIKTKFLMIFLGLIVVPGCIVGLLVWVSVERELERQISNELISVCRHKADYLTLLFNERVREVKVLAASKMVIAAVAKANNGNTNMDDDSIGEAIRRHDSEWINNRNNNVLAKTILANELSRSLLKFKHQDDSRYGEIFVTDRWGATVAMTKILSDYYQGDEFWWEQAYNHGIGDVFIDDRGFDQSTKTLVTGIVVPVRQDKKVIGILKVNYSIREVLDLISKIDVSMKNETILARSNGDAIFNRVDFDHHRDLSRAEVEIILDEENSFGQFEDIHDGKTHLMFYALLPISLYTRVPTPGEIKGISGEKWTPTQWHILIDISKAEALSSIRKGIQQLVLILSVLIIVGAGVAAYFSMTISRPIVALSENVRKISSGDLSEEIDDIQANDEIGDLADNFNQMFKIIKESQAVLEKEVNKKTNELMTNLKVSEEQNRQLLDTRNAMLNIAEDLDQEKSALLETREALLLSGKKISFKNRVLDIFLTVSDEQMYHKMMTLLLEIFASECGLFGYIDENGSFVIPTIIGQVQDTIEVDDKERHYPCELWGHSSWSQAIREKKTHLANKPSLTDQEELLPITRYISAPIIHNGRVIGLFQIANKQTNYDENDLSIVDSLARAIGPILDVRLNRDRLEEVRKRIEKERARLYVENIRKNRELEQIVYATSHDLRSPLVNVQGFSTELEAAFHEILMFCKSQKSSDEEMARIVPLLQEDIPESIDFIKKSTAKMSRLLDGLLRLSRIGRFVQTIEECDMNIIMADVIATAEYQIKEIGAVVNMGLLPSCKGDSSQLNQVFSNLIDNALKYLDLDRPGRISVSGHRIDDMAVFCVEDNGIGIAPEHQENIYDIFHRLNPAEGSGEGLGLTIVNRIVERNNGRISLESELGKGSRFLVELPV